MIRRVTSLRNAGGRRLSAAAAQAVETLERMNAAVCGCSLAR